MINLPIQLSKGETMFTDLPWLAIVVAELNTAIKGCVKFPSFAQAASM